MPEAVEHPSLQLLAVSARPVTASNTTPTARYPMFEYQRCSPGANRVFGVGDSDHVIAGRRREIRALERARPCV